MTTQTVVSSNWTHLWAHSMHDATTTDLVKAVRTCAVVKMTCLRLFVYYAKVELAKRGVTVEA